MAAKPAAFQPGYSVPPILGTPVFQGALPTGMMPFLLSFAGPKLSIGDIPGRGVLASVYFQWWVAKGRTL